MTSARKRMSIIFNEWAARYAADPESFSDILDDNGQPIEDYGDRCAVYYARLEAELDADGVLTEQK